MGARALDLKVLSYEVWRVRKECNLIKNMVPAHHADVQEMMERIVPLLEKLQVSVAANVSNTPRSAEEPCSSERSDLARPAYRPTAKPTPMPKSFPRTSQVVSAEITDST